MDAGCSALLAAAEPKAGFASSEARRYLVFEPGCAALVSSPVSHDVNASKHRLPLANSTGRTTLLGTALMDAGCSALLAAAEAKAGFASGGALLALTPG